MSGYTLIRTFDAPRSLVWECVTRPDHVAVWFGGHHGRMEGMASEPVVGGRWGGTMVLPDDTRIEWDGRYLEVEEPSRVVFAFTDQPPLGDDDTEGYAITLTELPDGRTELVLTQEGGALTKEQYEQAAHGTSSFLDVLEEHLAALQRA